MNNVKSSQVSGLRTRTASVPTLMLSPPSVVGYDGDPGVRPWEELVEVAMLQPALRNEYISSQLNFIRHLSEFNKQPVTIQFRSRESEAKVSFLVKVQYYSSCLSTR